MALVKIGNLKGPKGDAGTFVSASAESVSAASEPEAIIGGTPAASTVHFKIPEGSQGLPGVNAVENDAAVAGYVSTVGSSATKTAIADLIRAKQPHVDVHDYGAVGDGVADDTAAIQAAVDWSVAAGRKIALPGGTYRITATLNLPSRAVLSGVAGDTVLDVSGIANGVPALAAKGSLATPQSLSGDLVAGDTTMTPTDATSLAAGDYLKISSDQPFGSTSQPRGEFARIRSIAAGVITFEDPLHDSYPAAAGGKFEKATLVEDVTIEGVMLRGPETVRNIIATNFTLARNVVLRHIWAKNIHNTAIQFVDVLQSSVSDCHLSDSKLAGLACGIVALYASQDITITNCTGVRMRHLVSTGGGMSRPGVSRRIAVSNCTASQMDDAGFDTHPASEYVSFIGCHVNGSAQDGFTMQSGRFVIDGCTVSGTTRHGIFAQPLTRNGVDGIIANNRVSGGATGINVAVDPTADYRTWSGLAITGNIVTDANMGVRVENASTAFSVPGVVVANNIVRRTKTSHGVQLRGLTAPVVSGNHISGSGGPSEVVYLTTCPESVVSGNMLDGAGVSQRCLRLWESPNSAITGNVLKGAAGQGITSDATSGGVVYMGNRNLCATKGSLAGTGHLQSTADAGGSYNL